MFSNLLVGSDLTVFSSLFSLARDKQNQIFDSLQSLLGLVNYSIQFSSEQVLFARTPLFVKLLVYSPQEVKIVSLVFQERLVQLIWGIASK